MEDKEIIIDGVNVAGCKYYLFRDKQPAGERCCGVGLIDCNGQNCIYKQLKRLEQENATYKANADAVHKYITQNEQLKTHIDGLEKKNAELKADIKELSSIIVCKNGTIATLAKTRDNLKAENERLKEKIESYICSQNCYAYKQADKYHQTLQEIKAIAEASSPFIDNFEIKSATEVEYDYAVICNELEKRLHKVLELITKAESEG